MSTLVWIIAWCWIYTKPLLKPKLTYIFARISPKFDKLTLCLAWFILGNVKNIFHMFYHFLTLRWYWYLKFFPHEWQEPIFPSIPWLLMPWHRSISNYLVLTVQLSSLEIFQFSTRRVQNKTGRLLFHGYNYIPGIMCSGQCIRLTVIYWFQISPEITKHMTIIRYLTQCALVTPYGEIDLSQLWLR